MNLDASTLELLFFAALAVVAFAGFGGFAIVSMVEHERRATLISLAAAMLIGGAFAGCVLAPPFVRHVLFIITLAGFAIGLVLFFAPVGRRIAPGGNSRARVDERDIMFARGRLQPEMPEYDAYYHMRPENKAGDDRTRSLPGLFSPDAEMAEPVAFGAGEGSCIITEALREHGVGPVAGLKIEKSAEEWTAVVKDLTRYYGAQNAGVAVLQPQHVYSHIGRGVGTWGAEVEPQERWAIAFTVEMKHEAVARAPGAPTIMESVQRYVEISTIGVQLAAAIRNWGYPARAHTDGNYRVIAPLVARDAGLGDIGRMGLLMTPRLGPRVRIGVVTTDLPLIPDRPSDDRAMLDFCTICKKCAENCPVSAIPMGNRREDEGGLRWTLNSEACYRYWALIGTDCGICMRVCPYSHPDNPAHNLVRWAIARSGLARRVLLWMDDLFYRRKPEPRSAPPTGVP